VSITRGIDTDTDSLLVWMDNVDLASVSTMLLVLLLLLAFADPSRSNEHCGIRPAGDHHDSFRIAGGHPALVGAWPWMASIIISIADARICGATLIHPQWLLSAAHCLKQELDLDELSVEIGKYRLTQDESYTRYLNIS